MKITPININTFATFKGYVDDGIIGYDDAVSEANRNYIRSHYNSWKMPYQSIYEKEGRMTDYQLKLIIYDLEKNHDMRLIEGSNNIHRGQTLVEKPEYLKALKQKNIETIIDLVGYGKTYEKGVKDAELDYYVYNIYENWWEVSSFDVSHKNKLVNFLKKMQQGNIYIGCQHGANDTDIALILNDFFNPLLEGKIKTTIKPSDSDFPVKLNTLYDLFTQEDKKLLGWTKDFEKRLIRKLISI